MATTQAHLFHHVRDTSIECYRETVVPSLQKREQLVLEALQSFREPPTAYEVFEYMRARGTAVDVNSTRPRISSLAARGVVESAAKRRCRVTGKTVYTWRVK